MMTKSRRSFVNLLKQPQTLRSGAASNPRQLSNFAYGHVERKEAAEGQKGLLRPINEDSDEDDVVHQGGPAAASAGAAAAAAVVHIINASDDVLEHFEKKLRLEASSSSSSDDRVLIGRSNGHQHAAKNNGIFDCKVLSRRHAELRFAGGAVRMKDLGSSNGTYVNGEKIPPNEEVNVYSGDLIQFGQDVFENRCVEVKVKVTDSSSGRKICRPLAELRNCLEEAKERREIATLKLGEAQKLNRGLKSVSQKPLILDKIAELKSAIETDQLQQREQIIWLMENFAALVKIAEKVVAAQRKSLRTVFAVHAFAFLAVLIYFSEKFITESRPTLDYW